ncbi:MAG: M56 family metallopeptidase [Myxococcota bacterium]
MNEVTVWGLPLLTWLGLATLWTAAVYIVVRLLDGGLRRVLGPRARMALYALVLVRLVMPPDWSTPVGVAGLPQSDQPAASGAAFGMAQPEIAVPWLSRGRVVADAAPQTVAPPANPVPLSMLLYLLGLAALGGLAWVRRRSLRRLIAEAEPAPEIAGGPAEVLVHPSAGPFAAGVLRKVIVIPSPLRDSMDAHSLACVVAHERAHHEGHDIALSRVLSLVTALCWPIVAVWLAARRVRTLIEHAADERAVSGGHRKRYGSVLLSLVGHAATARPQPGLSAYRDLRARIVAIVRPASTPAITQLAIVGTVGAAIVACAAVPQDDITVETPRQADCVTLKRDATVAHDTAEKSGHDAKRDAVVEAYDAYLQVCRDDADYADMTYYAAEAHWARGAARHRAGDEARAADSFARARTLFDAAIEDGSAFTEDAALAQYLSTKNATRWEASEPAPCEGPGCEKLAFRAYEPRDREVLASWDRYVEVHGRPVGVSAAELLQMATLRMQHNDFASVRDDLMELVDEHAGTAEGLAGAEMLIDVLTIAWTNGDDEARAGAADDLEHWLVRIEANGTAGMPAARRLRDASETLLLGIAWKRGLALAETAQRSGDIADYVACAEHFEQLLADHPDHDRADALRSNAEACRERAPAQ